MLYTIRRLSRGERMGRQRSLKSKAVHFVSDLTTVFLNPISDKPSKPHHRSVPENVSESKGAQLESVAEHDSKAVADGPDTSSFTAFLISLLSSSETGGDDSNTEAQSDNKPEKEEASPAKESARKKSLFSRGKQSLSRAASKIGGFRGQERKGGSDKVTDDGNDSAGVEMKHVQNTKDSEAVVNVPQDASEPSLLLSEKSRNFLYASLPAIVQGRKWILLYSTWKHGISLSTLYRKSALWPGLSLLVVGDTKGAVFGGLVEAPLRPTNNRRYQGTNSSFVFTNTPGNPAIYRPTGANRYFTLCNTDSLAIGGGGHFALYLDGDLLNGSSSVSETYGNPCLAHSEDFEVKEVELWGFVYASKYEELLALGQAEAPGISRW